MPTCLVTKAYILVIAIEVVVFKDSAAIVADTLSVLACLGSGQEQAGKGSL